MSASDASLDAPRGAQGDERSRGDLLAVEDALGPDVQTEESEFHAKLKEQVLKFGETLSGRDLAIFEKRMLTEEPSTLGEIAETFGVSRERVRQLEERVKQRLRAQLEATFGDALPA